MNHELTFISQYSPQWTDAKVLEEILVQRQDLLAESVEKIRESILTANKHHLLFVGPRGSGKTHLVTLIHHRLQAPELEGKVRFAWLNEDEIATSFLKLLVLIYRSLTERYPDDFSPTTIAGLLGKDPAIAEETLGKTLLKELGEGKTLVVLVENLDALFKHMPSKELLRWRAFIQNHPVFATVATAQALVDEVADQEKPFFGFFDTHHLQPLSVADARQLLQNLAQRQAKDNLLEFLQSPVGKARVRAIHDLAGGNPRLYLVFSDFLDRERLDSLVSPFEEMVDRQLTSYYQERLRWLSPQQREIVQFLCRQGRPIPVKQIADGLFTTHNSITGQLKTLREMRYLTSRKRGREVYYELAEPLMRLALQVKETHDRKPLALIVDFLRVWHDVDNIKEQLAKLDSNSRGYAYFEETLALIDSGALNLRHEILRRRLETLPPEQIDDETLSIARCLAEESNSFSDWLKVGEILNARKDWDEAIAVLNRLTPDDTATTNELNKALINRGLANSKAGRPNEAISDFDRVIDQPSTNASHLAAALINRGYEYEQSGNWNEAISDYTRTIKLPDAPIEKIANARNNRGVVLRRTGHCDEAIADYTQVIDSVDNPIDEVAIAFNNRAWAYYHTARYDCALEDLSNLLSITDKSVRARLVVPRVSRYATMAIEAVFSNIRNWTKRVPRILEQFSNYTKLFELSDALIRHLPNLATSPLNHATHNTWADAWSTAVAELPPKQQEPFTIPLRLLRAGIEYLKSQDEGALLALPSEERKILREILELPPETDS